MLGHDFWARRGVEVIVGLVMLVVFGGAFLWIMDEPVSDPPATAPAPAKKLEPAASAPQETTTTEEAPAQEPEGTCSQFARQPEDDAYTGQALEFEDAGVPVFLRQGESCTDSHGYKWGG